MGLFDFLKSKPEVKEPEEDMESAVEVADEFEGDYIKQTMAAEVMIQIQEHGELNEHFMKEATKFLSSSEIRRIIRRKKEESVERVSLDEATTDKGEAGREYSKFITALEDHEDFLNTYELPNLTGDNKESGSSELIEQFGVLKEIYKRIIDEAEAYNEHRKGSFTKKLLYAIQNKSEKMQNRLRYVRKVKSMAQDEIEKISSFVTVYSFNPNFALKKLGYSKDEIPSISSLSWVDVLYSAKMEIELGKISESLGKGEVNTAFKADSNIGEVAIRLMHQEEVEESTKKEATSKSVLVALISRLLGSSVVTMSTGIETKRGYTEFMELGKGVSMKEFFESVDTEGPAFINSKLLKQLSEIQLIDTLCFNKDRHTDNVMIDMETYTLSAIDNDSAFFTENLNLEKGTKGTERIGGGLTKHEHLPKLGRYHDKKMAESILALDPQVLGFVASGLINNVEIAALKMRLADLQNYLKRSDVILVEDWTMDEFELDTWEEGMENQEGNYLNRLLSFHKGDPSGRQGRASHWNKLDESNPYKLRE